MRFFHGLALLLFLSLTGKAQDFLQLGNQWIFEHKKYIGQGNYQHLKYDSITITTDTLINGLSYFKLEATNKDLCDIFDFVEYLREDGSRIYRLSDDHSTDYLMIDFLEQDSFKIRTELYSEIITSTILIDSIRTTLFPSGHKLETRFLRILNSQSYEENTVYSLHDRIGYLDPGLLFPDIGTGLCDPFFEFMEAKCFISDQDTIRFTETPCFSSDIIDTVESPPKDIPQLFPNPTKGIVIIPKDYTLLSISNFSGTRFSWKNNNPGVDISHLVPGYYILYFKKKNANGFVTSIILKR